MVVPTLTHERKLWAAGSSRVVGVDEAGVGPLCAAVVAAAVLLPVELDAGRLDGVRDSKVIFNPRTREALAETVRSVALKVTIGAASPNEIERLNVRRATALAMRRALARIGEYDWALVDGLPMRDLDRGKHAFLVDGDALSLSIAAASVIAKVTRDRLMRLLAARYPGYGWERNVGYATREHLAALRRLGPTPHHRALFRPVLQAEMELGDVAPERFSVEPAGVPG